MAQIKLHMERPEYLLNCLDPENRILLNNDIGLALMSSVLYNTADKTTALFKRKEYGRVLELVDYINKAMNNTELDNSTNYASIQEDVYDPQGEHKNSYSRTVLHFFLHSVEPKVSRIVKQIHHDCTVYEKACYKLHFLWLPSVYRFIKYKRRSDAAVELLSALQLVIAGFEQGVNYE